MNPRMAETRVWLRERGFLVTGERALVSFATWESVRDAASEETHLWYHAPLDRHPTLVKVLRVYKNGGIRLHAYDCTFTADEGHLNRFRVRGVVAARGVAPSLPQPNALVGVK